MTDMWDEAIKAAAAKCQKVEDAMHRVGGHDFAEGASASRAAILRIPRPPEADRYAAIVAAALAWRKADASCCGALPGSPEEADGWRPLHAAEMAMRALCDAELAAQTEKGDDA